jgi:methionyl-tRNA synthetase
MARKIVVTSALPYANGPIHIGHLVEYIQTDIWVRFQKLRGNQCLYFCADDTHGTPVMISARDEGIRPEELIDRVHKEHKRDFDGFGIEFDNYYSTHSPENQQLSELIYGRLQEGGSIDKREVEQTYCENCNMWLPDRYIRGTCPRCKAEDQYGDSCDNCGGTYPSTELIDARCSKCGSPPVGRKSIHYFFKLADYEQQLKKLIADGHAHSSMANKLEEWFGAGLRDWDISRDGPYFGFKIPGEDDKYFYVWLDAPIGYMASAKNYCQRNGLDFDEVWNGKDWELYHFIGKDIMYFHALFWPAMLMCAGFKTANKLFVHGFLTVNGEKMSKSRGTFIKARTYLNHLDPEYLRYYYASKLSAKVEDIDLNTTDFANRVNSELVGKLTNLASRSVPMLTKKMDGKLGLLDDAGKELVQKLQNESQTIAEHYENLNYAAVIRTVAGLADEANRYVEQQQPWTTVKSDVEETRKTLTAVINAVRILTIYLKPVLPKYAKKVEQLLNVQPLKFEDSETIQEETQINDFVRLAERIEQEKVDAMMNGNKAPKDEGQKTGKSAEPIAPECTIEDFVKVDLRIAKVISARKVEGADKLLELRLDLGEVEKTSFAGVAQAYKPEELVDRLVVCLANLKPRKMKFGISECMILAAGDGKDIFILNVDSGAQLGQRVR